MTDPRPALGKAVVLRADALNLPLGDASVDLVVTSPPYWGLRSYQDGGKHYDGQVGDEATPAEFLRALWAVMDECWRVLKPGGSVWVNLGDKYAGSSGGGAPSAKSTLAGNGHVGGGPKQQSGGGRAKTTAQASDVRSKSLMGLPWRFALGCSDPTIRTAIESPALLVSETTHPQWILREEVIWAKPNGLPESVKDRCARKHEQWFHFTKSERYFSSIDLIRVPYAPASIATYAKGGAATAVSGNHPSSGNGAQQGGIPADYTGNPLGKLPGSVWTVPTEPLKVPDGYQGHFAAFPSEFPRRIIQGWAPLHVCDTCGEGLRPTATVVRTSSDKPRPEYGAGNHGRGASTLGPRNVVATLNQETCPCGPYDPTVRTYKPGVVLDPFGGTGTTAAVARALGRTGISVDLSADYSKLATWRVTDPKLEAKTRERTWPTPPKTRKASPAASIPAQQALGLDDCTATAP